MSAIDERMDTNDDPIFAELIAVIQPFTKLDPAKLNADTAISQIGIDSFDFVEIIFKLEETYGIDIDYNANSTFSEQTTIGDFAVQISRLIEAKKAT